jgi:hypothetical protein
MVTIDINPPWQLGTGEETKRVRALRVRGRDASAARAARSCHCRIAHLQSRRSLQRGVFAVTHGNVALRRQPVFRAPSKIFSRRI